MDLLIDDSDFDFEKQVKIDMKGKVEMEMCFIEKSVKKGTLKLTYFY